MATDPGSTPLNRRSLLRAVGLAGAGAAGAAFLAACGAPPAPTATPAPAKPADAKPADPAKAAAPASTPAPAAKPADAKPAAATGGKSVFNYAESGEFTDFNPWEYSAVNVEVYNQVFSRLTWKDGTGKINPDLATEWTLGADSLKLKLRDNVKWHDGKPLTAEDFVTMWGYLKDEAFAKYNGVNKIKGITAPFADMVAVDKLTLEIKFKGPTPYALDILDYFYAIRIEDKTDPGMLKKLPIGTGPYKAVEWVTNQYSRYTRNPDYYLKDVPKTDEIMFKRLSQAETLLPNLKSGALDGVLMTSLSDVAPLQADKNFTLDLNENAGSLFNIQVNVTKAPLDKKEVRQALSYSLNRAEMAKTAFFGVSRPITSPFYSPASLAYKEDLVMAHGFDLDKARKLLDQAGVKTLDLSIVVTPTWSQMKLFSLIWQSDLKKIGVNLKINEVESAKFYEINGKKDLEGNDLQAWLNARTTRDPAIFWNTQRNYRGQAPLNLWGYQNPEMEKMIADGAIESDPEKRKGIYQKLNELVLDQCHMIQVATNPRVFAYGKGVSGMRTDLNGNLVMDQVTVSR